LCVVQRRSAEKRHDEVDEVVFEARHRGAPGCSSVIAHPRPTRDRPAALVGDDSHAVVAMTRSFPGTISDVAVVRCESANTPAPGMKMPSGTKSMPSACGPAASAAGCADRDGGRERTAALRLKDDPPQRLGERKRSDNGPTCSRRDWRQQVTHPAFSRLRNRCAITKSFPADAVGQHAALAPPAPEASLRSTRAQWGPESLKGRVAYGEIGIAGGRCWRRVTSWLSGTAVRRRSRLLWTKGLRTRRRPSTLRGRRGRYGAGLPAGY